MKTFCQMAINSHHESKSECADDVISLRIMVSENNYLDSRVSPNGADQAFIGRPENQSLRESISHCLNPKYDGANRLKKVMYIVYFESLLF